jgi:hypothetical protein
MVAFLARAWAQWKVVARSIGNFQARLLLILFYFVVLSPFALAVRWGSNPLAIKNGTLRGWFPKADREGSSMERAIRQF